MDCVNKENDSDRAGLGLSHENFLDEFDAPP